MISCRCGGFQTVCVSEQQERETPAQSNMNATSYMYFCCLSKKKGLVYRTVRQELRKSSRLFGLVTFYFMCYKYGSDYDLRLLLLH